MRHRDFQLSIEVQMVVSVLNYNIMGGYLMYLTLVIGI